MAHLRPIRASVEDQAPDRAEPANQAALSGFHRFWKNRNLFLPALDALLIVAGFILAYQIRFHSNPALNLFPIKAGATPSIAPYIKIAVLLALIWVYLLAKEQAYGRGLHLSNSLADQILQVFKSGLYSLLLLMVISFMYRYFLLSRLTYFFGFFNALCFLSVCRLMIHMVNRHLDRECVVLTRVVLLGAQPYAHRVREHILEQNPCTAILGLMSWDDTEFSGGMPNGAVPDLGSLADMEELFQKVPFDQLIIVSHVKRHPVDNGSYNYPMIRALNFCEKNNISVYMFPDIMDVAVARQEVGSMAGVPLISLRDASLHPFYALMKRGVDLIVAGSVLVLGLPIWLFVAGLIKWTSEGPVFYCEKRVGLHGKLFIMYKFRSMIQNADEKLCELVDFSRLKEPVFNIRKDPRVTPVGRFLRRLSLDEIPQFINVLSGSMSVVGPRPEREELVGMYNPYQMRRLKAKPGITGYQQVTSRGDPSLAKRIEYDLWYLKHQGFLLDVFIMFKTFLVIIRGDATE